MRDFHEIPVRPTRQNRFRATVHMGEANYLCIQKSVNLLYAEMKDIIGYTEMAAQATDSVLLKMCQLR